MIFVKLTTEAVTWSSRMRQHRPDFEPVFQQLGAVGASCRRPLVTFAPLCAADDDAVRVTALSDLGLRPSMR